MEHLHLHLLRKGGGEPLDVQLLCIQAHRLDKQQMPLLVGKADHLVLNGGAVPGPHPLDDPGEQGGAVQIGPDDGVGLWRGGGEPAHSPVGRLLPGRKGEGLGVLVPRLDLQFGEIHATGVYPGGRPRLEAADGQTQIHQAPGQGQGGSQAVWPGVPDHLAHDGASPQIGAGGHDSRLHTINSSSVGDHAGHSTAFREDLHHLGLLYPQVFLKF